MQACLLVVMAQPLGACAPALHPGAGSRLRLGAVKSRHRCGSHRRFHSNPVASPRSGMGLSFMSDAALEGIKAVAASLQRLDLSGCIELTDAGARQGRCLPASLLARPAWQRSRSRPLA